MKTLRPATLVFLAIMTAASCSTNQPGKPFTLPSGHVIRVIALAPLNYTNGNPPSLMFQYQTDLKVSASDRPELLREVDEIWSVLRVDAERGHFTSAIVSAREVPSGLILKKAQGFNFVYEKNSDGVWHRLDSQTGTKQP